MDGLTTGRLAKQAGVKLDTIRFYEQKQLLSPPLRSQSGYRYFPESALHRIEFIKGAQKLGFSLEEIRELLALRVQPGATCSDVRQRAEQKMQEIDDKIHSLQRIRTALKRLTAACLSEAAVDECTILDGFTHTVWLGSPAARGERK